MALRALIDEDSLRLAAAIKDKSLRESGGVELLVHCGGGNGESHRKGSVSGSEFRYRGNRWQSGDYSLVPELAVVERSAGFFK
jgi:hypothetical protein